MVSLEDFEQCLVSSPNVTGKALWQLHFKVILRKLRRVTRGESVLCKRADVVWLH